MWCLGTILVALLIAMVIWEVSRDRRVYTKASNGKWYKVISGPRQQDKANTLGVIEDRINLVLHAVGVRFSKNVTFSEHAETSQHVAVTINKQDIRLCMKYHDLNTLMFVALHEVAHACSSDTGHTESFWELYRRLIEKAIELRVYTYQDYQSSPAKYCGTHISNSPYRTS